MGLKTLSSNFVFFLYRYFGMTALMSSNCTRDPRDFYWADVEYASYLNPIVLLWLYYIIVLTSKELFTAKVLLCLLMLFLKLTVSKRAWVFSNMY